MRNIKKRHSARVQIGVRSIKLSKTIYNALLPELYASRSLGSEVKILLKPNSIFFSFEAHSKATLRAIINNYIRWFITIKKSIEGMNLEHDDC